VQVLSSVAVEVALAAEAAPPGKDSQGNDLAIGEGSFRAGSLFRRLGVAEVVDHDVECSEEGVHIEHGSVPFPSGSGGKPTLVRGHLPHKFSVDNSHQAFKSTVAAKILGHTGNYFCQQAMLLPLRFSDLLSDQSCTPNWLSDTSQ
jgi:hypothetical protein